MQFASNIGGWMQAFDAQREVRRPDDLDARAEPLNGAYLADVAFAGAGSGLHHTICHVLGGAYDLPHADRQTAVLPQVVPFLGPMDRAAPRHGRRRGGRRPARARASDRRAHSLREIWMRETDLDEAAGLVAEKVSVELEEVRRRLEAVFVGRSSETTPEGAR